MPPENENKKSTAIVLQDLIKSLVKNSRNFLLLPLLFMLLLSSVVCILQSVVVCLFFLKSQLAIFPLRIRVDYLGKAICDRVALPSPTLLPIFWWDLARSEYLLLPWAL